MGSGTQFLQQISGSLKTDDFREESWQGSFGEFLEIVRQSPEVNRTSWQRLYDMILSYGTYSEGGDDEELLRYRFFDDPDNDGENAIFGLTRPLMELVNVFRGRPCATAPNAVSCCCTVRSAAPRARLPGCSSAVWNATAAPKRDACIHSAGRRPMASVTW